MDKIDELIEEAEKVHAHCGCRYDPLPVPPSVLAASLLAKVCKELKDFINLCCSCNEINNVIGAGRCGACITYKRANQIAEGEG